MKSFLYVRGMKEPIELSMIEGQAAEQLIASPAPSDTPFSIQGVWTGKKSEMKYVTFDKPEVRRESTQYKYDREEREHNEMMRKCSPEERAKMLAKFKMSWFTRSGFREKQPPEDVMHEAYEVGLKYLQEHPDELVPAFDVYLPIFQRHFGDKKEGSLADKMSV